MSLGLRIFGQLCRQPLLRLYSTKLPTELVVFQDKDMIICWHPEQPFPYEYSKPIPIKEPEPESVLKVGEKEVKALFRKPREQLVPEELARITYTCKHAWYPRARDKKSKNTEPDRPYM
ncbi:39S ribosomal protein L42, mitochondrial [Copidosoma floridanum]|uniref:39S ribosomal protein L42, mitochondrial n=1 Tax=Copidosoma floridanum TaxID=29053 RepID=UPI0006C956EC|nr:39S ribosomal protein L42, mitochondrial [Copidosoma floridanum]